MPGVRQEGRGVDEQGIVPCVPVHGLLAHDGDNGGSQGDGPGHRQGLVIAREDSLQPGLADAQAGEQQHDAQQQGSDAFQPFVTVGVFFVRVLFGNFDAHPGDEGGRHVGEGVDRVRDHGAGMAGDAGKQLEAGEHRVAEHADQGQFADDDRLIQRCRFALGCHTRNLLLRPGKTPAVCDFLVCTLPRALFQKSQKGIEKGTCGTYNCPTDAVNSSAAAAAARPHAPVEGIACSVCTGDLAPRWGM